MLRLGPNTAAITAISRVVARVGLDHHPTAVRTPGLAAAKRIETENGH
jgi:hypothetical protein